jgi:hypothetical protein
LGKRIGYAKLGRSMPLTLAKCGNLGGDVEMAAVVRELALRHPDDTFYLIGRNSGEHPSEIGLPPNVLNPWAQTGLWNWGDRLRKRVADAGLKGVVLTPDKQLKLAHIFDDLTFPLVETLDGIVMWIGQHGTSNTPIPKVDDPIQLTKPQDWCAWYSGFLLRAINHWRDVDPWNREEVNLNADARNRHKMRDLKWPLRHPVLAQFNSTKTIKHYRYGEPSGNMKLSGWAEYAKDIGNDTWTAPVRDVYSRLEINGLAPGTPFGNLISYDDEWARRQHFGLFINEARAIGIRPELQRRTILREWVLPLEPYFIHGTWSQDSGFGDVISPAPWDKYYTRLHSVRCTLTTPSSGSGWATAKPWEAFAGGTVCFFHPAYDTQDNILGDAPELRDWLRVRDPAELAFRVDHLNSQSGRSDWEWLVSAQQAHFTRALTELRYMKMIEERLYG